MAVVKEISVEHCKKVIITDNAYAHLSEEEIAERRDQIKERIEILARKDTAGVQEVDLSIKSLEENADTVAQTIYTRLKKESKTIGELKKEIKKYKMDIAYRKPNLANFLFEKIEKILDAEIEAIHLQ